MLENVTQSAVFIAFSVSPKKEKNKMTEIFTGRGRSDESRTQNRGMRNGKIDLLKFIFSMVVVIYHGKNVVGQREYMFLSGGGFAVEFFFIVSGYLLMRSISKIPTAPCRLGAETRNFIIQKYKSFCPEIFVVYAIALVFCSVVKNKNIWNLLITSFYEGSMLSMTGIHVTSVNNVVWYISSMLLCMSLLYPLVRKFPDMAVNYILPLSSLLILGYFCGNGRSARAPTEWMGWTYRGNLRAFAELSIGICCFEICKCLKKVNFTLAGKWLLTVVEYFCYSMILLYMYFNKASRQDYFYLILYAIAIIITFSEKTIDVGLFDNTICHFLGKYSFCLYLSHSFYAANLNSILPEHYSKTKQMLLYLFFSIATGIFVMCISCAIRKHWKTANKTIKDYFIIQT